MNGLKLSSGNYGKRALKKYRRQRSNHGFCAPDVWDMDVFLINVIPAMLRKLAETVDSYPSSYQSIQDWQETLTTLASKFEEVDLLSDTVLTVQRAEKRDALLKEAFCQLSDIFFDLWD